MKRDDYTSKRAMSTNNGCRNIGLYVHIPFCKSRCIYCDFYSTVRGERQDDYVDALCREADMRRDEADGLRLSSIYLGGGTPSQLSAGNMEKLFAHLAKTFGLNGDEDIEVTMECNPDDVSEDFAKQLGLLPVNRVSMGAQTFNEQRLSMLRRRHHSDDVARAIDRLRRAGISNISVDLMFGFPGETMEEWERDIHSAIALKADHLSAYSLTYEEGTPLMRMVEQGMVTPVDDELSRRMYERLIDRLDDAGYCHYEISNWALPHRQSRHNSSYWDDTPYIGIGAAAHSYDRKTRSWNIADIDSYIHAIGKGVRPAEYELIDRCTHYNDRITTALRTRQGLPLRELSSEERAFLMNAARQALSQGLLTISDDYLRLTRQGLFISDSIMSDLIWINEE